MEYKPSNNQLGRDFISVVQIIYHPGDHLRFQRIITNVEFSIADFYYSHDQSLDDLGIPKIGPKTISTLELILKNGPEKAREIKRREKKAQDKESLRY